MKTQKKIYKIQRKIDNYFQRILRSKSTYNNVDLKANTWLFRVG